jgi:hypothetical protein
MPRVGFQPTIPALERAKTVHVLQGAATVIAFLFCLQFLNFFNLTPLLILVHHVTALGRRNSAACNLPPALLVIYHASLPHSTTGIAIQS